MQTENSRNIISDSLVRDHVAALFASEEGRWKVYETEQRISRWFRPPLITYSYQLYYNTGDKWRRVVVTHRQLNSLEAGATGAELMAYIQGVIYHHSNSYAKGFKEGMRSVPPKEKLVYVDRLVSPPKDVDRKARAMDRWLRVIAEVQSQLPEKYTIQLVMEKDDFRVKLWKNRSIELPFTMGKDMAMTVRNALKAAKANAKAC